MQYSSSTKLVPAGSLSVTGFDRKVGQGHAGICPILLQRRVVPVLDLSGQEQARGVAGQLERLGETGDVVHEGHAGRGDRDELVGKRRRGRADARIHVAGVADRVVDRPVGELVTPLARVARRVVHAEVVGRLPDRVRPVRHRRGRERRAGPGDARRGDEAGVGGRPVGWPMWSTPWWRWSSCSRWSSSSPRCSWRTQLRPATAGAVTRMSASSDVTPTSAGALHRRRRARRSERLWWIGVIGDFTGSAPWQL